jgi:hypothetical protein
MRQARPRGNGWHLCEQGVPLPNVINRERQRKVSNLLFWRRASTLLKATDNLLLVRGTGARRVRPTDRHNRDDAW